MRLSKSDAALLRQSLKALALDVPSMRRIRKYAGQMPISGCIDYSRFNSRNKWLNKTHIYRALDALLADIHDKPANVYNVLWAISGGMYHFQQFPQAWRDELNTRYF